MCLGRSVAPIKRFLETCREFADKQRESFITVRTIGQYYHRESWDNTVLRPLRPLDTVHMDMQVKKDLVEDITNYLNPATRRFYTSRGIPYRRGYLLHGPPGTGKTSLSLALAGMFGLELYIVQVPTLGSDMELERLFSALPPKCIVLLEDIDAVGVKRQPMEKTKTNSDHEKPPWAADFEAATKGRGRCSLSGLLNVLDGVVSQEGRIVFMTANFSDNLDEALVRPGRIDKIIYMGRINREAAEEMFMRMYEPDKDEKPNAAETCAQTTVNKEELKTLATAFGSLVPRGVFTPAQLQGFLLNHRGEPNVAVARVEEWAEVEQKRMEEAEERERDTAKQKREKVESDERDREMRKAEMLAAALGKMSSQQNPVAVHPSLMEGASPLGLPQTNHANKPNGQSLLKAPDSKTTNGVTKDTSPTAASSDLDKGEETGEVLPVQH